MRNLTQEANIVKSMLAWSGFFVLVGVVVLIAALEYWLMSSFFGPVFWILQGLWAIGTGFVISIIAALVKSGQAAQNSSTKVSTDTLE
jgi:hypothetical protein